MKLSKRQPLISFCCFCSVLLPYTETNLESLNGRRILTVGLLIVKIVNKTQLRLILYFELLDLENFRLGSQIAFNAPPFLTACTFYENLEGQKNAVVIRPSSIDFISRETIT